MDDILPSFFLEYQSLLPFCYRELADGGHIGGAGWVEPGHICVGWSRSAKVCLLFP